MPSASYDRVGFKANEVEVIDVVNNEETNVQFPKLSNVIKELEILESINGTEHEIKGITDNSRDVLPGYLFVAISGLHVDGHLFIQNAVDAGAVAIIVETLPINPTSHVTYIKVADTRLALAKIAANFYHHPSKSLNLIGVTGTTGKTTTTFMLNTVFESAGLTTGMMGTLQKKIADMITPSYITTPGAIELQATLHEMVAKKVNVAVMEVSSHGLALDRVAYLNFAIGIFTNITNDHLAFHKTFTNYLEAKSKLFSQLGYHSFAILNADEAASKDFKEATRATVITYGINKAADIMAKDIKLTSHGSTFLVSLNRPIPTLKGGKILPAYFGMRLRVLGKHNVYNALAALAAALISGVNLKTINRALGQFNGVPRRMQLVYDGEFTVIDDFAHNHGSITSAFNTLKELNYGNLIIVNFLKGSRGEAANRDNAELITSWANDLRLKQIITTRSNALVLSKNIVTDTEETAFTEVIKQYNIPIMNTDELPIAIDYALTAVQPGDLILLLGTQGMDDGAAMIMERLGER